MNSKIYWKCCNEMQDKNCQPFHLPPNQPEERIRDKQEKIQRLSRTGLVGRGERTIAWGREQSKAQWSAGWKRGSKVLLLPFPYIP